MNLPYHWVAAGTMRPKWGTMPAVGALVPWDHAVWRVVEVRPYAAEGYPFVLVLRPREISDDDPNARDHDIHLACPLNAPPGVYPDGHYPVCAQCHEPLPCRAQMAKHVAEAMVRQAARFEVEGVCPACFEVVTDRQESRTFDENLEVPLGPPVTFHLRYRCKRAAMEYELRWVAADPEHRKATWTCTGHVTVHGETSYDCTQLASCPGPQAWHPSYSECGCHPPSRFGCRLTPQHRNEAEP